MSIKKKKQIVILSVVAIMLVALIVWMVWSNTALELNVYAVESDRLPDAFEGYRIAHISDLHNAEMGTGNEKLLSMLREAEPDMIAMTGDLVDSRDPDSEIALALAREAIKIAPCYYVTGNHEARLSENDFERLETGLTELFAVYAENGIDLVLSGHAHGGQFRLPLIGGLAAPNQGLFPKYDAGLYVEDYTNMIVSRGIGNSIVPFRFHNRPEVVLIELLS